MSLTGSVVDQADGAPIADARVWLTERIAGEPRYRRPREVVTDPVGRFVHLGDPKLRVLDRVLVIVAPGYAPLVRRWEPVPIEDVRLRLTAGTGREVRGRTIDAATGEPIPGLMLVSEPGRADRRRRR